MHTEALERRSSGWSQFKPLKFDLYILGEVVGPFFGGLMFFLFVFLMFQLLRLAEFLIVQGAPFLLLIKMTALLLISFLPFALPIAFLIAALVGFGRLSSDSEMVAMKASGLSMFRMAVPVFIFSLMVAGVSWGLNIDWVPWAEREFKSTYIKIGNSRVVTSIQEGTFTSGFFNLLLFADKVDSNENKLKRVFIFDEREPKNPLAVVAKEGEIFQVKTENEMDAAVLMRLYRGDIHNNDKEKQTYRKVNFGSYNLFLKMEAGTHGYAKKVRLLSYHELEEKLAQYDPASYDGREIRGEIWRRLSAGFAPVIFVLLGVGFGTVRTRSVRASAAIVAFFVILFYWSVLSYGTISVLRGTLTPPLAMNLANFILAGVGVWSFRRASW